MSRSRALAMVVALTCAAGCKGDSRPPAPDAAPAGPAPAAGDPEKGDFTLAEATAGLEGTGALMAEIATPLGSLACTLFEKESPRTVASFVGLARGVRPFEDPATRQWVKRPFFDGLTFHRVLPRFMIQGGDPLSAIDPQAPLVGTGGPGYELPEERGGGLRFDRAGRLAMANGGPGTGGSQFFVTEQPTRGLDGKHTIFGQCEPLDVVKEIARVPVLDDPEREGRPQHPLAMTVRIYRAAR